jgi:GntR family transcriptional regulator/MocR family aminotransferase
MVLSEGPVFAVSTGPLLALRLDRRRPLGVQLERRLRDLIRSGSLPLGSALPSTRAFAADLGVSRGVVVGAYAQLAAEGYIRLRRGTAPVIAALGRVPLDVGPEFDVPIAAARFNLRPDLPDLALFPRGEWLAAERVALRRAANTDLAYGEPFGAVRLRRRLAPFLARTRGVLADADRTGVFAGSSQALAVLASILRARGARRIAVEDPGHRWRTRTLVASGLEVVPVPVDAYGLRVDAMPDVAAVLVSPEHHFPLGVALAPERRRSLVEWGAAGDRLIIEHDYDGQFRYDRAPTGALQGLAPEHVAYVGTVSPLLAPTLRLGWAVVPAHLVVPVANHVFAASVATPRIAQLALAELIDRGYLDRHLRRARAAYRRRRDVVVAALARHLPDLVVGGEPAGLFVSVALPPEVDEGALLTGARERGFVLDGVNEHTISAQPAGLAIGFAASPEATLRRAIRELSAFH